MGDRPLERGSGVGSEIDRPRRPGRFVLALCTLAAILAGCGKGHDHIIGPDPPPTPFQYADLKTPQHALLNVKQVWENRDSVRTAQIYADDYAGTSTDQGDNSTLTFSKSDEVHVIGTLRRDGNITTVRVVLPPESTWVRTRYSSDPSGWTAIDLPTGGVLIGVYDTNGDEEAKSATFLEFKFRPTAIAGTDTTWAIVRWTEVANSLP
jgi:hypothetical protein